MPLLLNKNNKILLLEIKILFQRNNSYKFNSLYSRTKIYNIMICSIYQFIYIFVIAYFIIFTCILTFDKLRFEDLYFLFN